MRKLHTLHSRLVGTAASVALVASTLAASALPAGAQSCPTSGGGTTCFGGQAYCASSGQCYNPPICSGNQTYSCTACGCVCNTTLYPCGGCTAASSTAGATCSSPTGGRYTNQCGTCACPSGTTLCPSSNACVANRTCPQGTTWDPCTDTCGTPNVLLSPGFQQNGFVQISGEIRSTAGNLRLDTATGSGQGDIYLANGKSLRVDGAGLTTLNVGNWGVGGTGVNMSFGSGSGICLNGTCRGAWPSTTDFNPTYINANGDTMTGDLNLTGATTDLFVAGNLGVGTASPGSKLDVQLNVAGSSGVNFRNLSSGTGSATFVRVGNDVDNISGLYRNSSTNVTDYAGANSLNLVNTGAYPLGFVTGATTRMFISPTGDVGIGTTSPAARLDVNGTARMTGFRLTTGAGNGLVLMSDASGNGTWQTSPGISGSGSVNYLPKFTAASTVGNSQLFDSGTNVGIGTASPTALLHLNGSGTQLRVSSPAGGPQIELNRTTTSFRNSVIYSTGTNNDFEIGISQPDNGFTIRKITQQPMTGYNSFHVSGTGSGFVGINTVTPAAQLEVNSGSNTGLRVVGNSITSGSLIEATSTTVSASGNLIYGAINNANVSNTDFLEFQSGTTLTEKLRVSGSGQWIMRPTNSGTNGSLWIMLGTLANGFNTPAGIDAQFTDNTTGTGGYTALKVSAGFGGAGTGTKRLADFNAGASGVVIDKDGKLGIGTASPSAKLDVAYSGALGSGNNTAQFYAGSGNYSHVHWGTTGDWYVRSASNSGKVIMQDTGGNVGIGTSNPTRKLEVSSSGDAAYFGSSNSWFKMWTGGNSRLSLGDGSGYEAGFIAGGQNGSGQNTISIAACQDGGSCPQYITLNQSGNVGIGDNSPSYDLDVSGSIRATANIVLGGVSRSTWPSLQGTVVRTDFTTGQGAGWKRVNCPSGYIATGASGYNCDSNGGDWECSSTVLEDTSAQYYYSAEATAYTWTKCVRMN